MILQAFIGDDRCAALALIALDLVLVREGGQQLWQLAVTVGAHVEIGLDALDVQPRGADVDKAVGVLILLGRNVQQVVDLADVGLFRLRLRFGFGRRFRFGFGGRGRLGRGLLRAACGLFRLAGGLFGRGLRGVLDGGGLFVCLGQVVDEDEVVARVFE